MNDDQIEPISDDWSAAKSSQMRQSPLAVRGDVIAFAKDTELELVDAMALSRLNYMADRYWSICALSNGMLVGLAKGDQRPCEIDVIDGTSLVRSNNVPCIDVDRASLVASAGSEFYVVSDRSSLVRYRIANGNVTEVDRAELEARVRDGFVDHNQIVGVGDGRVIVPLTRALQIYEPGKPVVTCSTTGRHGGIAHVAIASRGRVWYSLFKAGESRVERVLLARLATDLATDAEISVAPSRITHMASGKSGALAMLLNTTGERAFTWTLVLLDENGAERWRTVVDDDIVKQVELDLNLAFVGVTTNRVVLATGKGLFGWDAANGKRIR